MISATFGFAGASMAATDNVNSDSLLGAIVPHYEDRGETINFPLPAALPESARTSLNQPHPDKDEFSKALRALDTADYPTALSIFKPLAQRGLAEAQSELGVMFFQGQGVPRNYAQAIAWWHKAAAQKNADAQYYLGLAYRDGLGVQRDDAKALSWWHMAAEQGDPRAQVKLGSMYYSGHGVAQNYGQAVAWWQKAANQGMGNAQVLLGLMYALGRGVPRSYVESAKWIIMAKGQTSQLFGDPLSTLTQQMSSQQMDDAEREARNWWAAHLSPDERLMAAATSDNIPELKAALQDGADVNRAVRTSYGPNPLLPLRVALTWRHYAAVKALLNAGADPNAAIDSVSCNALDVVQLLLEHGANPNYTYGASSGPLAGTVSRTSNPKGAVGAQTGAEDPCFKSAELLLKYGANVNGVKDAPSPLFVAIDMNSMRFARLFISKGANVNLVGNVGFPALIEAVRERLVQAGCLKGDGASCLEFGSDMPMIRLLLEHGANPNYRVKGQWMAYWDHHFPDNYFAGSTALCIAARYGLPKIAELLLQHGADPSIARSDGTLPLAIARENGNLTTAAVISSFMPKEQAEEQAPIPIPTGSRLQAVGIPKATGGSPHLSTATVQQLASTAASQSPYGYNMAQYVGFGTHYDPITHVWHVQYMVKPSLASAILEKRVHVDLDNTVNVFVFDESAHTEVTCPSLSRSGDPIGLTELPAPIRHFVPAGAYPLGLYCADLNDNGRSDYVLVTENSTQLTQDGKPTRRTLQILLQGQNGQYTSVVQNPDAIVSPLDAVPNGFYQIIARRERVEVVNDEGGSGGGNTYTFYFQYSSKDNAWLLTRAQNIQYGYVGVSPYTQLPDDFGSVTIADFKFKDFQY